MKLLGWIILAFFSFGQAAAAEDFDDVLSTQLLTGWMQKSGTHMAALSIRMAPGWHTYWRAPGDAGIPARFDWSGSENVGAMQVIWPRPEVIDQNGYRSIGYHDTVVLPIAFTPIKRGNDITLSGTVEIGVCKDICIPKSLRISAVLPSQSKKRDPRIAAALMDLPYSGRDVGARDVGCAITPTADGMSLSAQFTLPGSGAQDAVVIETGNRLLWVSAPDTQRAGDQFTARSDVAHVEGAPFAIDRSAIRITVLNENRAVEMTGCPRP